MAVDLEREDVLPEQSEVDSGWEWAQRQGMERELYYALAVPDVKGLTIRVLHALTNSRITTRAQVIALGVNGLLRVRNLGPKGIAYIRERLNAAEAAPRITQDEDAMAALRVLAEKGYSVQQVRAAYDAISGGSR